MFTRPNPSFCILCDVCRKQSSEDAHILTIFLFVNYRQWSRSANEAPGVYECVRQSGVTKQQARTQPWGSIIENTQPHACTPTLTSSLKTPSNLSAEIRASPSIMNKTQHCPPQTSMTHEHITPLLGYTAYTACYCTVQARPVLCHH